MNIIEPNEINPVALQIGTLIGLFVKEPDGYSFNSSWFSDPWVI